MQNHKPDAEKLELARLWVQPPILDTPSYHAKIVYICILGRMGIYYFQETSWMSSPSLLAISDLPVLEGRGRSHCNIPSERRQAKASLSFPLLDTRRHHTQVFQAGKAQKPHGGGWLLSLPPRPWLGLGLGKVDCEQGLGISQILP